MRTVAALLALSSVLLLIPVTQAVDDCQLNTSRVCRVILVERPAPPPPAPSVPDTPYWGTYYLYFGTAACAASPLANDCTGRPTSPGSGLPTPNGGSIGSGTGIGVLYKETNGSPGLQRFFALPIVPDRIILV